VSLRVCAEPDCPVLGTSTRCTEHERAKDKARGTRQERGYDAGHVRERNAQLEDAYGTRCHFCDERMWPHQELHLDHTEDRTGYRGITHAHCNLSDGARRGNALRTTRISPDG
jgi:hypothetical protein